MNFSGLYVATLSAFLQDGRPDYVATGRHARFLVESGVDGICPVGTTGEFLYLSVYEKVRFIEATCAASGAARVVAGVWGLSSAEAVLLTRSAEAAGADAVFLPPPIYYPATDEQMVRYYAAVKEASSLPVFAYNIPAYAANSLSIECIERMIGEGIVSGVKDSTGKSDRMRELVTHFGGRIAVEAASDSFAIEAKAIGADGFISAIANVFPRSFSELWNGDVSKGPMIDRLRGEIKRCGGIPAIKYLTGLRGIQVGSSRLPFSTLSPTDEAALDVVFQEAVDAGMS